MEQGQHYIVIGLVPLFEKTSPAALIRLSEQLTESVSTVTISSKKGNLRPSGQLLKVAPENIYLSAIKPSEDQKGYIIRLWETSGKDTNTQIYWMGQQFDTIIPKNQICSLKMTMSNGKWGLTKVNGIEQNC
jgi:alpha-mannosidase